MKCSTCWLEVLTLMTQRLKTFQYSSGSINNHSLYICLFGPAHNRSVRLALALLFTVLQHSIEKNWISSGMLSHNQSSLGGVWLDYTKWVYQLTHLSSLMRTCFEENCTEILLCCYLIELTYL